MSGRVQCIPLSVCSYSMNTWLVSFVVFFLNAFGDFWNVFGDLIKWAAQVGQFIQSKGGVVTAEELAPFLDPPERNKEDGAVEEDFVVPALVRFGGSPEVDERGNLIYRFESELLSISLGHRTLLLHRAVSLTNCHLGRSAVYTVSGLVTCNALRNLNHVTYSALAGSRRPLEVNLSMSWTPFLNIISILKLV